MKTKSAEEYKHLINQLIIESVKHFRDFGEGPFFDAGITNKELESSSNLVVLLQDKGVPPHFINALLIDVISVASRHYVSDYAAAAAATPRVPVIDWSTKRSDLKSTATMLCSFFSGPKKDLTVKFDEERVYADLVSRLDVTTEFHAAHKAAETTGEMDAVIKNTINGITAKLDLVRSSKCSENGNFANFCRAIESTTQDLAEWEFSPAFVEKLGISGKPLAPVDADMLDYKFSPMP